MHWFIICLKKYAVFSGRARRSEYWYFFLFFVVISGLSYILGEVVHDSFVFIGNIVQLVLFIPSIAVGVRRLHDTDRSGWWQLLNLIPLIGNIVFIVWMIQPGMSEPNRFGDDPKEDHQVSRESVDPNLSQSHLENSDSSHESP